MNELGINQNESNQKQQKTQKQKPAEPSVPVASQGGDGRGRDQGGDRMAYYSPSGSPNQ
jgi:hypothetical protein